MLRSMRSFPFFRKEQNVLLGLISHQNSKKEQKRTESSLKRTEKKGTYRTEKNAVPNPAEMIPLKSLWDLLLVQSLKLV